MPPIPPGGILFPFCIWPILRIISFDFSYLLITRFISAFVLPDPRAIRTLREFLKISGCLLSSLVFELKMASKLATSYSACIFCSSDNFGMPGIILRSPPREPNFCTCRICSSISSKSNLPDSMRLTDFFISFSSSSS